MYNNWFLQRFNVVFYIPLTAEQLSQYSDWYGQDGRGSIPDSGTGFYV
jgi:hypothetical protein